MPHTSGKRGYTFFISLTLKHFSPKSLHLSEEKRIFAEEKLHSAIWKQAFIALAGIFFAEEKLHSAIWKQAYIALAGIFFAEEKLHSAIWKQAYIALAGIFFAARKLNP